jgi:hypothetical protein
MNAVIIKLDKSRDCTGPYWMYSIVADSVALVTFVR